MSRTTGPGVPVGLKQLRERIERWRRTRERRTAMPAEMRSEAISLARSGRACAVARALRNNFEGLRRRMAEAAGTVGGDETTRSAAFVASWLVEKLGYLSPSQARAKWRIEKAA